MFDVAVILGSVFHVAAILSFMFQIQGAVILGGLFEHCIGMTGILGATKRWLGPLTISSVIIAIALAMVNLVLKKCSALWWICLL